MNSEFVIDTIVPGNSIAANSFDGARDNMASGDGEIFFAIIGVAHAYFDGGAGFALESFDTFVDIHMKCCFASNLEYDIASEDAGFEGW